MVLVLGLASAAMAAGSSSSSRPSKLDAAERAVKAADYARAIGLLKKVIVEEPNNADAYNYLGFSHRNLKQFDDAFAAYQKALAINPDHRGANEYLGELYLKIGKLAEAKERLKKLDEICTFGCREFDDLKQAIKAYEAARRG